MKTHRVKKENISKVLFLLEQEGVEAQECPAPPAFWGNDTDFPKEDEVPMVGVKCRLSGMEFHRFLVRHGVVAPWSRHDK